MKSLFKSIGKIVLFMALVQAIRAAVHWGLWIWLDSSGNYIKENLTDILAYTIVGIVFLLIFRPSRASLALTWQDISKRWKIIYISAAAFLFIMVIISFFLDKGLLLENFKAVIVIPIFEELIFRGWGWGEVEKNMPGKSAGIKTWLVMALLFALWHIGYTDIFYLQILPKNPGSTLGDFLLNKVIFTFFFGLAVGLLRWRTKKIHGSILLHGLLNLFGK